MGLLRDQFNYKELIEKPIPLLGENYQFRISDYPVLVDFSIKHHETFLLKNPLACVKEFFLSHAKQSGNINLSFSLCWNGFQDAVSLLFGFVESFQRNIRLENIKNTTETDQIGDFGLTWVWSGEKQRTVLAFVRNNVLITIKGRQISDLIVPLAREIDNQLKVLNVTLKYNDSTGILSEVKKKKGEVPVVNAGKRIDIGKSPKKDRQLFFLVSGGSMNRDYENPDLWYYRAGMDKGSYSITLFKETSGILPIRESMTVEIIHKEV